MSQAICLADWDGTLRRGYVLEDWMQFLYSAHVASGDDLATIDSFFRKHECREIDYGQMAEGVVRAYTSMLRGKNYDTCRNLARRFVEADSKVFEFAGPLIEALRRDGVAVILVSGAPSIVLDEFARRMNVFRSYGVSSAVDQFGSFTGEVGANLATKKEKERLARRLSVEFPEIVLALGNSESDEPLFRAARAGWLIVADANDEQNLSQHQDFKNLNHFSPERVLSFLENEGLPQNHKW